MAELAFVTVFDTHMRRKSWQRARNI